MKHKKHIGGKASSNPLPPHTVPALAPNSHGKISYPPPFIIEQYRERQRRQDHPTDESRDGP